nr:unnamed protein product [Callosobruchus chinensis]
MGIEIFESVNWGNGESDTVKCRKDCSSTTISNPFLRILKQRVVQESIGSMAVLCDNAIFLVLS